VFYNQIQSLQRYTYRSELSDNTPLEQGHKIVARRRRTEPKTAAHLQSAHRCIATVATRFSSNLIYNPDRYTRLTKAASPGQQPPDIFIAGAMSNLTEPHTGGSLQIARFGSHAGSLYAFVKCVCVGEKKCSPRQIESCKATHISQPPCTTVKREECSPRLLL